MSAASGGSSNILAMNVNQFGDVIADMRTSWEHWKLNRLKISSWLGQHITSVISSGTIETADLIVAVGYTCVNAAQFASVPSMNSATQLPVFAMGTNQRVTVDVDQSELDRRTAKWLLTTNTGTQPVELQEHGTLFYGTYGLTAISGALQHVLLEGEVSFRDRIDSSVSLTTPQPFDPTPPVGVRTVVALEQKVTCSSLADEASFSDADLVPPVLRLMREPLETVSLPLPPCPLPRSGSGAPTRKGR